MKKFIAIVACGMLAACGTSTDTAEETSDGIEFVDMWTKATDEQMTGSFGTISNRTDNDLDVTAVRIEEAGRSEIHETVMDGGTSSMQEMAEGFTVEAGSDYVLEPGGNHLMFMDLTEELQAGNTITVTLETNQGELTFDSEIRTYTGAQEEYGVHGEDETDEHDGHDHGDHEEHDDSQ